MTRELDKALQAAKAETPEGRLDRIEPAVWRRIEAMRASREASAIFVPVRIAAVAAALGIGVAAGGFAAAEARHQSRTSQEVAAFSVASRLAPSTLLEGRR